MRSDLIVAFSLVGVLAVSAACGDADSPTGRDLPQNSIAAAGPSLTPEGLNTLSYLRGSLDHRVFETPKDLLVDRPDAFVGTVDAVLPGRSIVSGSGELRTRYNTVVLRIKVAKTVKSESRASVDGLLFVSLPRGANAIDANGDVIPEDPNPSLDEVRKALPQGLRVVVVSGPVDQRLDNAGAQRVESDPTPMPRGAILLEGIHPQTITFDEGDQPLAEWPEYTFEKFAAEVTG